MISPGVKVMRSVPKDGEAGYSGSVGGDIRFFPSAKVGLFCSYYWSPDAWTEHSDGLRQADAGISFRPVSLLDVTIGYRYAAIEVKMVQQIMSLLTVFLLVAAFISESYKFLRLMKVNIPSVSQLPLQATLSL